MPNGSAEAEPAALRAGRQLCKVMSPLRPGPDDDASGTWVTLLEPAERLWNAGDRATHVGVLCAGRLVAVRQRAQREVVFDVLRPGDLLGELALGPERRHVSNVSSIRRSLVALVPAQAVTVRLTRSPALAVEWLRRCSDSIERLSARIDALSSGNVEHRLASVLLGLVERFGEPFPGGVLVPLKLRRHDLAAMAGTTQESVSRCLATWRRRAFLQPQPAGYLVRDVGALQRLLEFD